MSGRPGHRTMEMNGGSSASYLARTPCVPLFSTLFNTDGNRRAFRLSGEGGDHFHCTVEPVVWSESVSNSGLEMFWQRPYRREFAIAVPDPSPSFVNLVCFGLGLLE